MASNTHKTGRNRGDSFDVGVRETVAVPLPTVWAFLVGEGLPLWLGETELPHDQNAEYETDDGVRGIIHRYAENSRVKLTWRPGDWPTTRHSPSPSSRRMPARRSASVTRASPTGTSAP
jgi:uncharacterized protein YndB with AHSA1/START domain